MTNGVTKADLGKGLAAGLLATAAMSLVMLAGRKLGPTAKLPPKKITEAAVKATTDHRPEDSTLNAAAGLAHFGFGGGAGAAFGALRPLVGDGPAQGVMYGLLVWTISYKGWIPALGIMPPPQRDEPRRAALMVAAHVVYGAVLGSILKARGR